MDRGALTIAVLGDDTFVERMVRQFRQFAEVIPVPSLRELEDLGRSRDWTIGITNLTAADDATSRDLPLTFYLGAGSRPEWLPANALALLEPTPSFNVLNYAMFQRDRRKRQLG